MVWIFLMISKEFLLGISLRKLIFLCDNCYLKHLYSYEELKHFYDILFSFDHA